MYALTFLSEQNGSIAYMDFFSLKVNKQVKKCEKMYHTSGTWYLGIFYLSKIKVGNSDVQF